MFPCVILSSTPNVILAICSAFFLVTLLHRFSSRYILCYRLYFTDMLLCSFRKLWLSLTPSNHRLFLQFHILNFGLASNKTGLYAISRFQSSMRVREHCVRPCVRVFVCGLKCMHNVRAACVRRCVYACVRECHYLLCYRCYVLQSPQNII